MSCMITLRWSQTNYECSGHMDLNQTPGTLRWAEWADASLQRGLNSRQIVQIESEQNLLGALKAMNHR